MEALGNLIRKVIAEAKPISAKIKNETADAIHASDK